MISRDKAPTAQETFMQMAQAAGLRSRLFVTVRYFNFGSRWRIFACTRN
jgi:hypothetical protein